VATSFWLVVAGLVVVVVRGMWKMGREGRGTWWLVVLSLVVVVEGWTWIGKGG